MSIDEHQQEVLAGLMPTTLLSEIADWFQGHLEPEDIFTEIQLRTWALDNGMVVNPDDEPESPSGAPVYWSDNQVDDIANDECSDCRKKYKIVEVFDATVNAICDCGPSEFDLVPEGDLDEAAIHH